MPLTDPGQHEVDRRMVRTPACIEREERHE